MSSRSLVQTPQRVARPLYQGLVFPESREQNAPMMLPDLDLAVENLDRGHNLYMSFPDLEDLG